MTIGERIDAIREQLSGQLLILGHHYQNDGVLRHVDAIGDSLELSRKATAEKDARKIVFCGVHFMAESADILTSDWQTVYMPDPTATCPMADMAAEDQVGVAWEILRKAGDNWVPVVYVNSSAAIKSFAGEHGGSTCTSSNAARIFQWVLGQGKRVFFLPDAHLGANTAHDLGLPDEEVVLYDPSFPDGGIPPGLLKRTKVAAWRGYCHVHQEFKIPTVKQVREQFPNAKIIVHPENPKEVVRLSDAHGSTSQIIDYAGKAPAGSTVFIGTEASLVQRLARLHAGRIVVKALSLSVCHNMALTSDEKLLELLEHWPALNEIHVPPELKVGARKALQRMLDIL